MSVASTEKGNGGAVPVCALGASAGGLEPLRAFFKAVPPDLGFAYVVMVHLAPDHPSALAEILGGVTRMPVDTAHDGAVLHADHVYITPHDHELVIEGNQLRAVAFEAPRGRRSPIDRLFETVADLRANGVAIVLSGQGADGAAGVRVVHEAGGLVLAQDPGEAEHRSMPSAAIETGAVDVIAPIAALAGRVADIARSRYDIAALHAEREQDTLRGIIATLRRRVGHDFSHYKAATLLRRIGRRMQVVRSATLADYADHLRGSEHEARALFADLLISVTSFFRDPDAFEALRREAIVPIFDRLETREAAAIRVWSVGCATGEEAYSLAMLLIEEAERRKTAVPIQVFATDIDETALGKAREGVYGGAIEADLSEARRTRFFVSEGETWRVRQELRDTVLFARHSVLKDPPFMHLDLVACRNLLIYLDREMQRQVLGVLRYALDPGGFLMLGTAETADTAPEMFRALDRDARLYAAESGPGRVIQLAADAPSGPFAPPPQPRTPTVDRGAGALHLEALEVVGPPSALVGQDQRVLHLSPNAGRFLMPSGGPLTLDLPALARPELRLDLKVALHRALDEGQPTLTMPTEVAFNGARRRVVLNVKPDPKADPTAPRALVLFLDGGLVGESEDPSNAEDRPDETRRLHAELRAAQERLAASRSEHDVAVQELRAANEELQSVNEEYRSTSEELETSKEELQSMNEELQTLNAELKSKLESVSSANNDLRNLVAATDFGTLFLDTELRIRMFTPSVTQVFRLEASDIGRPITDFSHTLDGAGIEADARSVLRDLAPVDRDARTSDGRWLTIRVRPYRTLEDRIEGVVVTFVDVTATRSATERLRETQEWLALATKASRIGRVIWDPRTREAQWDERGREIMGLRPEDTQPEDWLARLHPDDRAAVEAHLSERITTGQPFDMEFRVVHPDGSVRHVNGSGAFVRNAAGAVIRGTGLIQDVTARFQADETQRLLLAELNHRVKNMLTVVLAIAAQTRAEAPSLAAFADAFEERLQAISLAHDAMTRNGWHGARLAELVEATIEVLAPAQKAGITAHGPAVQLGTNAATTVSLALHELCTNAIKYGALSAAAGQIEIVWDMTDQAPGRRFTFAWRERGGPTVAPPTRRGFGSELLEDGLPGELDGSARLDFAPEGVVYTLEAPVSEQLHDG
jgi:two-component system CheB/CheR fusion protein